MKNNARSETEIDAFVGARVRALRKASGWSQKDLASRVGITFEQVQNYERGVNRIGAGRLWDFSLVFGVMPGSFFEGLAKAPPRPGMIGSAGPR